MSRLLTYLAAAIWALFVVFGVSILLAVCIGQATDGVKGWWQLIPLAGVLTIQIAAGVWAFRRALRWQGWWPWM